MSPILQALAAEGYTVPTPIQSQAIPHVLAGRDVVGAAQTGTGKTAAFSLPLLQRLTEKPVRPVARTIRALILAPTRELASQIEESIRNYGRFLNISSTVAFGGVPIGRQRRALSTGLDILVATPGRLLDLVDSGDLKLGSVEVLILDEADRMLDLGFIHALKRVAMLVPADRQTLFFSATMPKPIRELASRFLRQPVEVAVAPVASAADTVDQSVILTRTDRKPALLAHVLSQSTMERAIVFTRTKHGADKVVRQLDQAGIASAAIHGNKSQVQREKALELFKSGRTRVLIATDIAARGIDVDGISHVVNYDLPNIPESYVHRIGRTGRAGASGAAIAFCTPDEKAFLADIEHLMRRKINRVDEPTGLVILPQLRSNPEQERHVDPRRGNGERSFGGRSSQGPRTGAPGGRPQGERNYGNRDDNRQPRESASFGQLVKHMASDTGGEAGASRSSAPRPNGGDRPNSGRPGPNRSGGPGRDRTEPRAIVR